MLYSVSVTADARREIIALPGHVRAQLRTMVSELHLEPRPERAKELRNRPDFYRVWLATKWRVVYAVDDEHQHVVIVRVRLKDQIDYDSI